MSAATLKHTLIAAAFLGPPPGFRAHMSAATLKHTLIAAAFLGPPPGFRAHMSAATLKRRGIHLITDIPRQLIPRSHERGHIEATAATLKRLRPRMHRRGPTRHSALT